MPENGEGDVFAELRRRIDATKAPLVAYIVLDHSWDLALPVVKGRDRQGRLYVLTSPALLDELKRAPDRPVYEASLALTGIPVYRREDMPEGWDEERDRAR